MDVVHDMSQLDIATGILVQSHVALDGKLGAASLLFGHELSTSGIKRLCPISSQALLESRRTYPLQEVNETRRSPHLKSFGLESSDIEMLPLQFPSEDSSLAPRLVHGSHPPLPSPSPPLLALFTPPPLEKGGPPRSLIEGLGSPPSLSS